MRGLRERRELTDATQPLSLSLGQDKAENLPGSRTHLSRACRRQYTRGHGSRTSSAFEHTSWKTEMDVRVRSEASGSGGSGVLQTTQLTFSLFHFTCCQVNNIL